MYLIKKLKKTLGQQKVLVCSMGRLQTPLNQIRNWALCKPSLNLTQSIDKKSENLQWEKCRYITDKERTFSDTAQYFLS